MNCIGFRCTRSFAAAATRADEAADLTQAFFLHLIEKHALASADPSLGRFRGFLLVSLKHFLANEHERRSALRRGGGRVDLPLDLDDLERRYRTTTADASPERLFDRQWALTMIERALGSIADPSHRDDTDTGARVRGAVGVSH